MKHLILFLLFVFIMRSSSAQKPAGFIPEEYKYPYVKIGKGITKSFQNLETTEQVFVHLKAQIVSNERCLFQTRYFKGKIVDSSVVVNNKLEELFVFVDGRAIKEDIKTDTVIKKKERYGKHLFTSTHSINGSTVTHMLTEEYVKDTSISWKGKLMDCIEIRVTALDLSKSMFSSLQNQAEQTGYVIYYAKGMGIIRYTVEGYNKIYTFALQEVTDYN